MEADEQLDRDSTFGGDRESIASSSQSLDSEATRYVHEFGRRYHGYQAGKYNFPNDEREQNRMDVEHHNQRLQMDGKLHLCPMDDPKQILDLGCGSGIWAMDMADEYPACQVIGTDLSPIQPIWVPPNCKFEVDDFELEWWAYQSNIDLTRMELTFYRTFGEARFDMIHERFLMGSISSHTELYKNIYSALKPGGWFELVEMETLTFSDDGTVAEDSACNQWGRLQMEAFAKMGKRMPPASDYEPLLKESGFVNIKTQIMKRPTNDWPRDPRMKDIGRVCEQSTHACSKRIDLW